MKMDRLLNVFATLLMIFLAAGCGGGKSAPTTVKAEGVSVEVPSALAKQVTAKTLEPKALEAMPRVNEKASVLAAAEFGPSGTSLPDGAKVTWKLPSKQTPGTELWIVTFDKDLGEWLNTGERAVVQPDGLTAAGVVRHFSVIGVSPVAATHTEMDDPEKARQAAYKRIIVPKFPAKSGSGGHAPEAIDPKKFEAARKVYENWANGDPLKPMTKEAMCEIYRVADYKTVKALCQKKIIGETHSIAMADLRTAMVVGTLLQIGAEKKWAIYRSDTGNQSSGMTSDMDQTLVVKEVRPDGSEVRNEKADAELCKLFKERFDRLNHGITTEHFDICSIAGSDKPPEWRLTQTQVDESSLRPVKLHIAETMVNLRNTPGAYTYVGAIVSQVQARVAAAMEQKLRSDAEIESGAAPRPDPRKQPLADEVKALGIASSEQIAMHKLGPDANGQWRSHEVSRETAREVVFDGVKPELARGHAYDSAVANYLEHMHHLNDRIPEAKYHVRALNDAAFLIAYLEGNVPKKGAEYEKLSGAERLEYLRKSLGADLPDAFLNRWKKCLDISADLRSAHKDNKLNEAAVDKAMEPLAQEFGTTILGAPDKAAHDQALETALAAYRSRCQEFLAYNVVKNCKERVLDWLIVNPERGARGDVDKLVNAEDVKNALDPEGKMDPSSWEKAKAELFQNYSEIARLQLLFSFREMPQEVVDRCMREIETGRSPPIFKDGKVVDKGGKHFSPEEIAKVKALMVDARDPKWAEKAFPEYPDIYKALYEMEAKKLAEAKEAARGEFMQRWSENFKVFVLGQVGLGHPETPSKVVEFCNRRGWQAMTKPLNSRVGCITGRVAMHYICDPGSYQAGIEVMRAYAESDGDPKVWRKAAMEQAIYMIPIYGQGKAFVEGDWVTRGIVVISFVLPGAAEMQMTLAIGESALVIYENEFVRPITNGLADAAYKGWVGPSLKEYGVDAREVKQFTEEDEKALADLQEQIGQIKARTGPYANVSNAVKLLSDMLRKEQEMLDKRAVWDAYNSEMNRLEHNNQTVHKRLNLPAATDYPECAMNTPGPLLARVKPIIFYSRSTQGDIDLTMTFTEAERDRLDSLPKLVKAETDPIKRVALQEEQDVLAERLSEYDRAQKYLKEMKTNYELALQIERDSLYPYRMTDEDAKTDMKNPREFVKDWLRIRRSLLPKALLDVGVGDGTWNPHVFSDAEEALVDRFLADFERSKKLWLARGQYKTALRQAEETRFHRRQAHELMNVLGEAAVAPPVRLSSGAQGLLSAAGLKPEEAVKLNDLAEALRLRHMPEAPPIVKVGLVTSTDADNKTVITPDIKVTANPRIYIPPYQVVWYQLGPDEVRSAYASRTYLGLPLSDEDAKVLKAYVDALGTDKPAKASDKDPVNPLFLTFVFCAEARIPKRVVPETVDELPPLQKYSIPMPKGMVGPEGGGASGGPIASGYLFGSYACMLQPAGPLKIVLRRYDRTYEQSGTEIVVTSKSLGELDRKKNEQLKFNIYVAPSEDGPFEKALEFLYMPGDPIVKDVGMESKYKRIAKDKVVLALDYPYLNSRRLNWPDEPLYYRVGEQARPASGPLGKETLSNVAGPGGSILFVSLKSTHEDTGDSARFAGPYNPELTLHLGIDNQYFDFRDAHFVIDDGVRKVHRYSNRREGKLRFGGNQDSDDSDACARLLMRPPPGDVKLTVTADCEGHSATRTVTVTVEQSDKERQDLDHKLKFEKDKHDSYITSLRSALASDQKAEADAQKELSRKPLVVKSWGDDGWRWFAIEKDAVNREFRVRMISEHDLPKADADYDAVTADLHHDWASAARAERRKLDLMKKEYDIEVARINALVVVTKKYQALPGAPADVAIDPKTAIDDLKVNLYLWLPRKNSDMIEHAYLAGDLQLVRDLTNLFIFSEQELWRIAQIKDRRRDDRMPKSSKEVDDFTGRMLMQYTEQYVDLTGDRAGAAGFYVKGYRLMAKTPPVEQLIYLPIWWPEGKEGNAFMPVEKPKDTKESKPAPAPAKASDTSKVPDKSKVPAAPKGK